MTVNHKGNLNLQSLLGAVEVLEVRGTLPQTIASLAYHTGKVQAGDLFFCIKGYVSDGHKYLGAAIDKGAVAAIVEDFVADEALEESQRSVPQIRVANSRLALALMASAFYGHPSQKLHMIGVTATNGKTSTSFMIDSILKASGKETGIIGTVMTCYGKVLIPSVLTTPESLDLHSYFADMLTSGVTHATMEVSSSGLELNRVGGVDFDVVTFNNLSAEHVDQHGSFEAYKNHKSRLIREAKQGAWAVLNQDDDYVKTLAGETKAHVLTYGVKAKDADIVVESLDLSTGRARMQVTLVRDLETDFRRVKAVSFEVLLSVAGYHSAINALAAIGVALVSGIDVPSIQAGLSAYKGVERRFEIIYEAGAGNEDFMIVDDHFANAGNIDVTLETMSMMTYRDLHLVYAIRGSRGVITNGENAAVIVKWAKALGLTKMIATRSVSHVGPKDVVTDDEYKVFMETMARANIDVQVFDELGDAVAAGLEAAKPSDVVLLAGCQGMDYGGKLALEALIAMRPHLTDVQKAGIMGALDGRVCGMEPLQ